MCVAPRPSFFRLVVVFARVVDRIAGGIRFRLAGLLARIFRRIVLARVLRWTIFLISHGVLSIDGERPPCFVGVDDVVPEA